MNCFILSTNLCKLLHSKCGMCKLFFVLVLFFSFLSPFHKGHRNWWSGQTSYTVEPEQTWAAGPVASWAWHRECLTDEIDTRKTNSLPNLFISYFWAWPLTQATIADSLQWGCYVVISAIHPILLFLFEKWERRRNQTSMLTDNCFCHLRIMFLACAYSMATITEFLHWAILAIQFCWEFFFIHNEFFSFCPLGYFHPFSSRISFHSHGQFFFLSIGLF